VPLDFDEAERKFRDSPGNLASRFRQMDGLIVGGIGVFWAPHSDIGCGLLSQSN
jgi:hypothetical protein